MSDRLDTDEKRFMLKQKFLKSAIAQGRGAEAIAKLNALYRNVQKTLEGSDDAMVTGWRPHLGGPDKDITLSELQRALSIDESPYIRRYNMFQILTGSDKRLHTRMIMPGSPAIN